MLRETRKDGRGCYNPAIWSRIYTLTTRMTENRDGNKYYAWEIVESRKTVDVPGGTDVYVVARELSAAVCAGRTNVAYTGSEIDEGAGTESADTASKKEFGF